MSREKLSRNSLSVTGQALVPHLLTSGFEPDPHSQAVLRGQRRGQVKDVVASAIGQAMEVQMSRCEPGVGDRVDLRAELKLDLVETGASEKFRTPGGRRREHFACVVEQRGHFLFRGQVLPPSLFEHLAAELSVDDSAQFCEDRRQPGHIA
jgi:hypothetical protein